VLAVPIIDASDPREQDLVSLRITHNAVRHTIQAATVGTERAWANHTFNEVFVGGRWRRLNYDRLGQNILDDTYLGLMVHVHSFRDWSEAGLVAWGLRTARDPKSDVFGGTNPYSCVSLSDQFGAHAKVDNPPVPEHRVLTVSRAYWLEDPGRPAMVKYDRVEDPVDGGHLLLHVDESRDGEGTGQYKVFYSRVAKGFVLRAQGRPDVQAQARRGYWVEAGSGVRDFYVHIAPAEYARMARGIPYSIAPAGAATAPYRFRVMDGVTLTRP
jgi:hypothetical protein